MKRFLRPMRFLAAIAAVALAVSAIPAQWLPPCFFHKLTGLHCPGCGTTRALHQLASGRLLAALHCNALVMLALPALGWWWCRRDRVSVPPLWLWTTVAVAVAYGILRNLPAWPFTLLAPA